MFLALQGVDSFDELLSVLKRVLSASNDEDLLKRTADWSAPLELAQARAAQSDGESATTAVKAAVRLKAWVVDDCCENTPHAIADSPAWQKLAAGEDFEAVGKAHGQGGRIHDLGWVPLYTGPFPESSSSKRGQEYANAQGFWQSFNKWPGTVFGALNGVIPGDDSRPGSGHYIDIVADDSAGGSRLEISNLEGRSLQAPESNQFMVVQVTGFRAHRDLTFDHLECWAGCSQPVVGMKIPSTVPGELVYIASQLENAHRAALLTVIEEAISSLSAEVRGFTGINTRDKINEINREVSLQVAESHARVCMTPFGSTKPASAHNFQSTIDHCESAIDAEKAAKGSNQPIDGGFAYGKTLTGHTPAKLVAKRDSIAPRLKAALAKEAKEKAEKARQNSANNASRSNTNSSNNQYRAECERSYPRNVGASYSKWMSCCMEKMPNTSVVSRTCIQ